MKNYILIILIAALFLSIVVGAVTRNQATTQQKKLKTKNNCGKAGTFANSLCNQKSGGTKKSSGISLPSEPFRGLDTGITYK